MIGALELSDLPRVEPILAEWRDTAMYRAATVGVFLDASRVLETLGHLIASANAVVLGSESGGELTGIMGLHLQPYHAGQQIIARECCFFVRPGYRSAGVSLIRAAEAWARAKGASHLVLTASRVAGDADRAERLYSALGFAPFEMDSIKELK